MTLATDTPAMRAPKSPPRLERVAFRSSRLLEFCSEKELTLQTGHPASEWPLVIVKELLDNALDACEEADIVPVVTVKVDAGIIEVTDNGPGLPEATLDGVLDYTVRASSREAYVSPTRGAQGNALKTVLAMPYALDGADQRGVVEIEAKGQRHTIEFAVDHVRQEPVIRRNAEPCGRQVGTSVRVHWPVSPRSDLERAKVRFLQIADDFTWLNPHLALTIDWRGDRLTVPATTLDWAKWLPAEPTSPHWYEREHLQRLIGAYLKVDEDAGRPRRTVREFFSEFRGLTGTAKQKKVLEATGLAMAPLSKLVVGERFDALLVGRLLDAMKANSRPVKSKQLGLIGEQHLRTRFETHGCAAKSFKYTKVLGKDGLPKVAEIAFAAIEDEKRGRRLVTGVNWSPGINDPFRSLGKDGESAKAHLARLWASSDEPIIVFMHMACPRVQYTDRGKSAVVVS